LLKVKGRDLDGVVSRRQDSGEKLCGVFLNRRLKKNVSYS
jgi:hypothetical protein